MNEPAKHKQHEIMDDLTRKVQRKEERKIRARAEQDRSVWFGLGMFGLVGWSVTIPTLLFLGIGVWVDRKWPSQHSWTLMLLVIGVILGCWNAWYWVKKQSSEE